jgi:D-glycero-D-manno-heptose 1,7-bisphosphate phosphatase
MGKHGLKLRAVFLDRDGVLNIPIVRCGRPYPPSDLSEFRLYEDAIDGCERLKAAGFLLVVVTNQPDVGRRTQARAAVQEIHDALQLALPMIDRIETCFHAGERHGQPCNCRKPRPGMLQRTAAELNIDLSRSYMIGDRWRDIDCARAADCRAVFIDRGYLEQLRESPDFSVGSFTEAVDVVLSEVESA